MSTQEDQLESSDPLRKRMTMIVNAWMFHLARHDQDFELVVGDTMQRMTMSAARTLEILASDDEKLHAAAKRVVTLLQRRDLALAVDSGMNGGVPQQAISVPPSNNAKHKGVFLDS